MLDSSSIIDIERATKRPNQDWAVNTLRNAVAYRELYAQFTISSSTYFEILVGFVRVGDDRGYNAAKTQALTQWEILYPSAKVVELAAQVYGVLERSGSRIGVNDTLIAATAISHRLTLVTSNPSHFERVQSAGFELKMQNWRQP